MGENIIYCYSGSGNCLDMAQEIARNLGDTDIVMIRRAPLIKDATQYKRVGFIFPCHGGGLPAGMEENIRSLRLNKASYKFGVVQYSGYMGCGLSKIDKIVGLDYWSGVSNHCSAIWLMPHDFTIPRTTIETAQKRSDDAAKVVACDVRRMLKRAKKPAGNLFCSIESLGFARMNRKINAAMNISDACSGCGTCERICPAGNIQVVDGMAAIGSKCLGCMSCIEYCPAKAINVGRITQKRERYHNMNVSAEDLARDIIHID